MQEHYPVSLNNQTKQHHTKKNRKKKNTKPNEKELINTFSGLTSLQFGKGQETLTLQGEDMDIATLGETLKKKVGKTEILSFSQI